MAICCWYGWFGTSALECKEAIFVGITVYRDPQGVCMDATCAYSFLSRYYNVWGKRYVDNSLFPYVLHVYITMTDLLCPSFLNFTLIFWYRTIGGIKYYITTNLQLLKCPYGQARADLPFEANLRSVSDPALCNRKSCKQVNKSASLLHRGMWSKFCNAHSHALLLNDINHLGPILIFDWS
jgi:hypothetical protein